MTSISALPTDIPIETSTTLPATEELIIEQTDPAPTLSKNAQKRLLKAQKREEMKAERKAKDKAAKKAKQLARKRAREEEEEGEGEDARPEGAEKGDGPPVAKKQKTGESTQQEPVQKTPFNARLVVDLGFDDKMTDREIVSLVSQCGYCYGSNRRSKTPFTSLMFTGLGGRTYERFEMLKTYKNWRGVEFWDTGYEDLWRDEESMVSPQEASTSSKTAISSSSVIVIEDVETSATKTDGSAPLESDGTVFKPPKERSSTAKGTVVYLSADSNVEMTELQEGETYIIGGICDKNRYKNLCQDKAVSQGVRTARLPIGTYLKELPTRKVLTVNQVVDILLKWVEKRNWEEAFYEVVPKRKFEPGRKKERLKKANSKWVEKRVESDLAVAENKDAAEEDGDPGSGNEEDASMSTNEEPVLKEITEQAH